MAVDYSLHTALVLWSFLTGAFLCAVYDVFRVFRLRRKMNGLLLFISDLCYSFVAITAFLLLFFNLSYGRVRLYGLVFALAGFLLWRFTVSRLAMAVINKIISFFERVIDSFTLFVKSQIKILSRKIYTKNYCRRNISSAKKGFIKRKEIKTNEENGEN